MSRFHHVCVAAVGCLLIASAGSAQTPQAQAAPPLSLADAISQAIAASSLVAAAKLQDRIDQASVAVAAERPNPEVSYEWEKETPRMAFGTAFPIELGDKRQRRVDLATATRAVGGAALNRLIAGIRTAIRRAYFDVVAAEARVAIAKDIRELAARAREGARVRVVAGDAPQADLTQSDLAVAWAENDLLAADGEAAATRATLNTFLGRAPDTDLRATDTLEGGVVPALSDAVARAQASSVELQLFDRRLAEQRARVRLESATTVPDLTAGGTLVYDAEPEFRYGWRISAAVTVPLFTRHRAAVTVASLTVDQIELERDAARLTITGDVAAAIARANAARAQVVRYRDVILPLAREGERQAQAAYDGGQTGLSALVVALQSARDTRERGVTAGMEFQRALADLEDAMGGI